MKINFDRIENAIVFLERAGKEHPDVTEAFKARSHARMLREELKAARQMSREHDAFKFWVQA